MKKDDQAEVTHQEVLENFRYDKYTGALYMPKRYGDKPLSGVCTGGYIRVFFKGKRYKAHRLIMFMVNGFWPEHVDHLNRQRSDNRWANLEPSNYCENSKNRSKRSDNNSGFCGVHYSEKKNRYIAQVVCRGKHMLQKSFVDFESAKNAVIEKRKELKFNLTHGE